MFQLYICTALLVPLSLCLSSIAYCQRHIHQHYATDDEDEEGPCIYRGRRGGVTGRLMDKSFQRLSLLLLYRTVRSLLEARKWPPTGPKRSARVASISFRRRLVFGQQLNTHPPNLPKLATRYISYTAPVVALLHLPYCICAVAATFNATLQETSQGRSIAPKKFYWTLVSVYLHLRFLNKSKKRRKKNATIFNNIQYTIAQSKPAATT